MKVLIIEDEIEIAEAIHNYFLGSPVVCEIVTNVKDASEKIDLYDYDCILLDIGLPDGSGFDILEEIKIRKKSDSVIIISAKNSLDDKLKGLEIGADDFLTKPFHMAELAMRITAVTRRKMFDGNNIVEFGGITLDLINNTVKYQNENLDLTPREFRLLRLFLSSHQRVLSKTAIADHLLGEQVDFVDSDKLVYAHIKNLKKKLQQAGCPEYIKTVYGIGYKFSID
ncbi:response regulator transcription factor [Belliella pelovolcani]|uniref:DNA-binding response regulator, OmpR family, contains REC and winged-helix (WHTH) domain n=1 Tax=Belliella pelovolcani TaxID=529505 RepID=A0A1N7LWG6_9BACT|nr:response regulator transcription factor [Belliella pelovolcani]SIS78170.1 DNA-binding response regulator, OmpR family, contains REC and winged-helix (wHTH) domain [Belliella pelovolcani]